MAFGAGGRRRTLLFGAVTVALSSAACVAVAELTLRFLPVASMLRAAPVNAAQPVFRFEPNQTFVHSDDWDFKRVVRTRINNAGFVNDRDYDPNGLPLLAVIGDSYIAGAMLPQPQTLHGRLAARLDGRMRVYSFAASGAPLSQYLIWARLAVREFGAQALLINVVGNDFDESHAGHKSAPGFWLYARDRDGALRLRLTEYRPSPWRDWIGNSALARYLAFNLHAGTLWSRLRTLWLPEPAAGPDAYVGNTAAAAGAARLRDSLAVLDAFFRDLPDYAGLPPDRILFVVDGVRYPQAAAAESYFGLMRKALLAKAQALGYAAIDLDLFFLERHRRSGERFEFPDDGHWNAAGHAVAFEAVAGSRFLQELLTAVDNNSTATLRRMN